MTQAFPTSKPIVAEFIVTMDKSMEGETRRFITKSPIGWRELTKEEEDLYLNDGQKHNP